MATQFDPIAKDESLNTTEVTPRNIADVLAEELSGIASALTPAQLNSLADVTASIVCILPLLCDGVIFQRLTVRR